MSTQSRPAWSLIACSISAIRPVGMKNARAVAIAEVNDRFARGRSTADGGGDDSPPPERAAVIADSPDPLGFRALAGRLCGLEADRFVDDVDHERLGRLGGDGTANR